VIVMAENCGQQVAARACMHRCQAATVMMGNADIAADCECVKNAWASQTASEHAAPPSSLLSLPHKITDGMNFKTVNSETKNKTDYNGGQWEGGSRLSQNNRKDRIVERT
jgi:hypothetical protein